MSKLTNKFIIIYDHPLNNNTEQYWGTTKCDHTQVGRTVYLREPPVLGWNKIAVFGDNIKTIPIKRASQYVEYINLTKAQYTDILLSNYHISTLIPNIVDIKTGVWKYQHKIKYKEMIRILRKELER